MNCLAPAILIAVSGLCSAQLYTIATVTGGTPLPASSASLNSVIDPAGLVRDNAGNIYFSSDNCVYKTDSRGILTRIAGTSRGGYSGDGGPALNAQLNGPAGLAFDPAGNLLIADASNYRIRKVDANGVITTVAGSGVKGTSGDGGPAVSAQLDAPTSIAVDPQGNLFIGDQNFVYFAEPSIAHVRRVSPDGIIADVPTGADLKGAAVAVDSSGNLFVADTGNNMVRKVSAGGTTSFLVTCGSTFPISLAIDNAGDIFVGLAPYFDGVMPCVTKITPAGISTVVAGGGMYFISTTAIPISGASSVAPDGSGGVLIADTARILDVSGAGIPATIAGRSTQQFQNLGGIATDMAGNLYVAEYAQNRIQKFAPDGTVTTLANTNFDPYLATDAVGNLYMASSTEILKASPQGSVTSVFNGASMGWSISAMAVDAAGNVFVADRASLIRKISTTGTISTVTTTGSAVSGLAVDAAGNLYFADGARIRQISASGTVTTIAGNAKPGYSGDGGRALAASIGTGDTLAVDSAGNLFLGDSANQRVRKISPDGTITTIAGNGTRGYSGDGGPAIAAQFFSPESITVDGAGNVYVVDAFNYAVRVLRPSVQAVLVAAVVDAASESATAVSPGKTVAIYGAGFGTTGTTVSINGFPAPVLYSTPTQIGAVVPYEIAGTNALVTVTNQAQQSSLPFTVPVAASSPAIFTLNESGAGQAAAVNLDGSINTAANPVKIGGFISIYATGEGQTSPLGVDGKLAGMPLPHPNLPVTATVDGQPAPIQYFGGAPGEIAGLMQVNIQIPAGVRPGGYVPVVLQVGNTLSREGVTIAVTAN